MPYETAMPQWQEGLRRLQQAPPDDRRLLERVTDRVVDELRRRLGGPFTTEELVQLYDQGTSWISDVAVAAAPDDPEAWDVRIVGDAAFARYLREATDFAGGRRRVLEG
jgi:DNA-directed RNA polymerase specialized sigma24 family protein